MKKHDHIIAFIVLIVLAVLVCLPLWAPHIFAQNSGNTGTFTAAQSVFVNQSSLQSSAIFKNIGQSAHYLTACGNNFHGEIDLEASFDTKFTPPVVLSRAIVPHNGCIVLQAGGYFQNVRSTMNPDPGNAGTLSASYQSSSGPIGFAAPGVGTTGPTSPPLCDGLSTSVVPSGTTATINNVGVFGVTPAQQFVCAYSISFKAATANGSISFQSVTPPVTCPGGPSTELWTISTTVNTPQIVSLASSTPLFRTGDTKLCFINGSGSDVELSLAVGSTF